MAENGTIAYVAELPACNFPHSMVDGGDPTPAKYDFRTDTGQWAYGCEEHFQAHRMHETLGTGKGQKLEVRGD